MDKYSPSEFISNCFSFLRTKLFFRECRFIRFPFYIRGKQSMKGAVNLTLGRFCRFELDGKHKTLSIGKNCEMGDMTHIVALNHIEIGNNVLIASKCFISDTSHGIYKGKIQDSPTTPPNSRKLYSTSVKIGNNVWIGENVVILAGSVIGDGCIIGANSVVNSNIPCNSLAVGAPARIKKVFDEDSKTWVRER
ncbi:MAG: acetyltransferase [Ruminococcus sp.]|jgi:acetyltransferase-like isoleucine patch superfamily enzyme|nr:acetyltransferase [Ruminococcus sp.]